jgi:pimeloyl-ACP methyl ester carboxylesterase
VVLSRFVTPVAASIDDYFARAITGRGKKRRSGPETLGPGERASQLTAIAEAYEAAEPFDDVGRFFGAPTPIDPRHSLVGTRRSRAGLVDVFDLRWPSRIDCFHPDQELGARYAATRENHDAAARLFAHRGGKRPTVIVVHGYLAGRYAIEERIWPVGFLLDRGVDVALYVLPFHAVRAEPDTPHRFPSSDPRFSNEGFRQAIFELRSFVAHLRERGSSMVGAMGMSLGGYTVSLLATVEPSLAFVAPVIPLASFADVAHEADRFVGTHAQKAEQHRLLDRVHRVVSPFARSSKLERGAAVVVAGRGDRITPSSHGERLAAHLGAELHLMPGGHLLQIGRAEGFRAIARMMKRRGAFEA